MIGQTIAQSRIHAKLGEGGMGAVYRAEDLTLGREVALKFLSRGATFDPEARRLVKEAQAASRLNHPNIATIYELNVTETVPLIVMKLVPGRTLKEKLRLGSLSPAELLNTMRQIGAGLQEAHCADDPWPTQRFAVKYPRWKPYAGKPQVRLCAVGA